MKRKEELINRELLPQEIHQRVVDGTIDAREGYRLLLDLELNTRIEDIKAEAAKLRISLVKQNLVWEVARNDKSYTEKYINEGVDQFEAPVLAILEIYVGVPFVKGDITQFYCYDIDDEGHIIRLFLFDSDVFVIGVFPQQICRLRFLQELDFPSHDIRTFPECIRNLTNLKMVDLSNNHIQEIPTFIKELPHLKELYVADNIINRFHRNVLELIDIASLTEIFSVKKIHDMIKELNKKEKFFPFK